jgi:hypothetical protein
MTEVCCMKYCAIPQNLQPFILFRLNYMICRLKRDLDTLQSDGVHSNIPDIMQRVIIDQLSSSKLNIIIKCAIGCKTTVVTNEFDMLRGNMNTNKCIEVSNICRGKESCVYTLEVPKYYPTEGQPTIFMQGDMDLIPVPLRILSKQVWNPTTYKNILLHILEALVEYSSDLDTNALSEDLNCWRISSTTSIFGSDQRARSHSTRSIGHHENKPYDECDTDKSSILHYSNSIDNDYDNGAFICSDDSNDCLLASQGQNISSVKESFTMGDDRNHMSSDLDYLNCDRARYSSSNLNYLDDTSVHPDYPCGNNDNDSDRSICGDPDEASSLEGDLHSRSNSNDICNSNSNYSNGQMRYQVGFDSNFADDVGDSFGFCNSSGSSGVVYQADGLGGILRGLSMHSCGIGNSYNSHGFSCTTEMNNNMNNGDMSDMSIGMVDMGTNNQAPYSSSFRNDNNGRYQSSCTADAWSADMGEDET